MPADANAQPRDFTWRSKDGLELYAREYGAPNSRLPVVLMHGLTRNSRDFEDVAPWIATQGRRVFAVDFRGRGRSSWKGEPRRYNVRVYAGDIARLATAAGLGRAIFIGTSLGGRVATALAARRPKLVAGVILNDVGPHIGRAGLARIAAYAGRPAPVRTWDDAAEYARRTNGHAFPDYGDQDWRIFARRLFREDANGVPVLDYDPRIFPGMTPFFRLLLRLVEWLDWRAFARLARCPNLLLIRGADSYILEPETVARMRRIAPDMRIAEIPGVGHAPMLSEPAAKTAICEFLARAP